MDNFRVIYRILREMERAMDCDSLDRRKVGPEALGISFNRWACIVLLLNENGYISGDRITLKGLEYLEENSLMRKAANLAKGIAEVL